MAIPPRADSGPRGKGAPGSGAPAEKPLPIGRAILVGLFLALGVILVFLFLVSQTPPGRLLISRVNTGVSTTYERGLVEIKGTIRDEVAALVVPPTATPEPTVAVTAVPSPTRTPRPTPPSAPTALSGPIRAPVAIPPPAEKLDPAAAEKTLRAFYDALNSGNINHSLTYWLLESADSGKDFAQLSISRKERFTVRAVEIKADTGLGVLNGIVTVDIVRADGSESLGISHLYQIGRAHV